MGPCEEIDIFSDYVKKNYDIKNELIKTKYVHTMNVVSIMMKICEKMNLNDEDTKLAFHIALFHDLGRFREVVRQQRFNNLTFDHGAYSNKVLFNDNFIENFSVSKDDYLLIRKAIYFHNKKDLPDNLSERELFFCKLIRDADRIDIFRVLSMTFLNTLKFDDFPTDVVLKAFYEGKSIDLRNMHNRSDRVVLRFDFVKLFSFKESKEALDFFGYFDDYVKAIEVSSHLRELFDSLVEETKNCIKGVSENVRKKVRPFNG